MKCDICKRKLNKWRGSLYNMHITKKGHIEKCQHDGSYEGIMAIYDPEKKKVEK